MKAHLRPGLILLLAVFAMSWAGPLVRLSEAPPLAIAAWRLVFSVAFIGLVLAGRGRGARSAELLPGEWGLAAAAGVLLALHFWSWIASISFTTVASSVVLVSTQPLFVAVLSLSLLGERPSRREWIAVLLAVLGAMVVGWGDFELGGRALFGDFLALLGAVFAAGYYVVGRRLRQKLDLWSYVGVVYGVAALVLLGLALASGVPLIAYPPREWGIFLLLAAGPMMIGHTGINYALRHVRAYLANLVVLGEPVGAILIAWVLPQIREVPPGRTLAGGMLILVGVAIGFAGRRRRKEAAA